MMRMEILYPRVISDDKKGRNDMSGMMMLAAGAGMGILAVVLLIVSIIYRQTAGKKIREELKRDYAQ